MNFENVYAVESTMIERPLFLFFPSTALILICLPVGKGAAVPVVELPPLASGENISAEGPTIFTAVVVKVVARAGIELETIATGRPSTADIVGMTLTPESDEGCCCEDGIAESRGLSCSEDAVCGTETALAGAGWAKVVLSKSCVPRPSPRVRSLVLYPWDGFAGVNSGCAPGADNTGAWTPDEVAAAVLESPPTEE